LVAMMDVASRDQTPSTDAALIKMRMITGTVYWQLSSVISVLQMQINYQILAKVMRLTISISMFMTVEAVTEATVKKRTFKYLTHLSNLANSAA
ncbi:MAG: hypothetical protein EZS28_034229, partial [Streblomastix strix]